MRIRDKEMNRTSCVIVLLLCWLLLPAIVSGVEKITQKDVVNESRGSSLIVKGVRVDEVPVRVASSEHYVLKWMEREVTGDDSEPGPGLSNQPELPRTLSLSQNYPNPFNPTTTITFDLPGDTGEKEHVELFVYDLRGRRVMTLIDTELEPGRHSIVWDGRDDRGVRVSSGIYLYRLGAGEGAYTKKMTVVK